MALFASRPRFRLRGSVGLAFGLAISGAVSMRGEVVTDRKYLTILKVICDLSLLRTASNLRRNSPSDESRTYIRPFIRISVHPAGSS